MPDNFERDMDRFLKKANGNMDKAIKGVLFELSRRIVEYSPVGDSSYWKIEPPPGYVGGHFRHNWQYKLNAEPSGELEGTTNDYLGRLNVQYKLPAGVHYITNHVHYAIRLENGWSRQARGPNAVVGRAILGFQSLVTKVVRGIR